LLEISLVVFIQMPMLILAFDRGTHHDIYAQKPFDAGQYASVNKIVASLDNSNN